MSNTLLTLAQEITALEDRLASKKRELARYIGSPSAEPRRTIPAQPSAPVSDRARRALLSGPMTFGDLWTRVSAAGPANKYALRSFLGKARERGEVAFDRGTGMYSAAEKTKAPVGPPPGPSPKKRERATS